MSTLRSVFIGIGSNIDPQRHLASASGHIRARWPSAVCSSVYRTAAQYETHQPDFLNAVCRIETRDAVPVIMEALRTIEDVEEKRKSTRYGPRTIDLDLLLYGEEIIPGREEWLRAKQLHDDYSPELFVPHLRMDDRAFVIIPLAELAPSFSHPVTGVTIEELVHKTAHQQCERIDWLT
mgnify:FL=1